MRYKASPDAKKGSNLSFIWMILLVVLLSGMLFSACEAASVSDNGSNSGNCNGTNNCNTTNYVNSGNSPQSGQGNQSSSSSQSTTGLSPATVQSWCSTIPGSTGTCDISRFEQLRESSGVINPNAVHMLTGEPVILNIPAGYYIEGWDCFNSFTVHGPTSVKVCAGSIREG
jgi:hypothetical protein